MEDHYIYDEQFKEMEKRFSEMEEIIESMDKKLNQVVDALLGNPLTNQGGFIQKMGEIEEKIQKLEKKQAETDTFKNRVLWTIGIGIGFATVIGIVLKSAIELYITNIQATK